MIVMSIRELTRNQGTKLSGAAREIIRKLNRGEIVVTSLEDAMRIAYYHRTEDEK